MKDNSQLIKEHLQKYIGSKISITKNLDFQDKDLKFEIIIFRANNGRPYHIVSTVGLSNYKMKGKSKSIEILLYLDKSWNLFSSDEQFSWVYNMIKQIANAFYVAKRPFEYGSCFLTTGSNTFAPCTKLNSAVLYYPVGLDNDSWSLKTGFNKKIDFYLLTCATYREYALIRRMGGLSFVKNYLLEEGDLENLVVFNKKEEKDD